jgi:hypothetical protein
MTIDIGSAQNRARLLSVLWSFILYQHMPLYGLRVRAARGRGGKDLEI